MPPLPKSLSKYLSDTGAFRFDAFGFKAGVLRKSASGQSEKLVRFETAAGQPVEIVLSFELAMQLGECLYPRAVQAQAEAGGAR